VRIPQNASVALVAHLVLRPEPFGDSEAFLETPHPLSLAHAEGFELGGAVAQPHAENHVAAGNHVQGGNGFRGVDGVVQG
jgi:hypothetical protein